MHEKEIKLNLSLYMLKRACLFFHACTPQINQVIAKIDLIFFKSQ